MPHKVKNIEIEIINRVFWADAHGKKRSAYKAQIKGVPGHWGCGSTSEEALGSLVMAFPEKLKLNIIYPPPE